MIPHVANKMPNAGTIFPRPWRAVLTKFFGSFCAFPE